MNPLPLHLKDHNLKGVAVGPAELRVIRTIVLADAMIFTIQFGPVWLATG
jgi:hypothetical protein